MHISFTPLTQHQFTLMLTWLAKPHIKAWWDPDITWTPELIAEKYGSYVQGFKVEDVIPKKIEAYIIKYDHKPIGYIQLYNAYDFKRSSELIDLPARLAAFDFFIGEEAYLGKGIGTQALTLFLGTYAKDYYDYVLADPELNNVAAIRTYEKAEFERVERAYQEADIWMIKKLT